MFSGSWGPRRPARGSSSWSGGHRAVGSCPVGLQQLATSGHSCPGHWRCHQCPPRHRAHTRRVDLTLPWAGPGPTGTWPAQTAWALIAAPELAGTPEPGRGLRAGGGDSEPGGGLRARGEGDSEPGGGGLRAGGGDSEPGWEGLRARGGEQSWGDRDSKSRWRRTRG